MDSRRKFFKLTDASSDTRGFGWCSRYGPLEQMPFLTPNYIEEQREFWKCCGNPAPGMVVDNGNPCSKAKKWPDFLGNGSINPSFFVSEKIVQSLDQEKIPFFRLTEMPIAEIQAKGLQGTIPPKYFVLEVEPGIHLDYGASQVPVDEHGTPQFRLRPSHFGVWDIGCLKTWNGADLFTWDGFPVMIQSRLLCTERIVGIAKKYKWTNVKFEPVWAQ